MSRGEGHRGDQGLPPARTWRGGLPTGLKWELMAKESEEQKYLICNADEGTGAYMNRNEMEGIPTPHRGHAHPPML